MPSARRYKCSKVRSLLNGGDGKLTSWDKTDAEVRDCLATTRSNSFGTNDRFEMGQQLLGRA